MNNKTKAGMFSVIALYAIAAVASLGTTAQAGSLKDQQAAKLGAKEFNLRANSSASTAMRVFYIGSQTEALLTISSGVVSAEAPDGTADTNFVFNTGDAAYDTMKELCDSITELDDYGCELLAAKGDDSPLILRDQTGTSGTNDLKAAGGYEVTFDTGPTLGGTTDEIYHMSVGRVPPSEKRLILKSCEWDSTGTGNLTVYGLQDVFVDNNGGRTGNVVRAQKNVWDSVDVEQTITANTEQSEDWTNGGSSQGLMFARGTQLVVRYDDTTNTSVQDTDNDLRCLIEER